MSRSIGYLGCGEYEARVVERGGGAIVSLPDWTTLRWTRVLDDTSDGVVIVDGECLGSLGSSKSWRHELALYRDGGGEPVWVGPIVEPSAPVQSDHLQFQLAARGITAWWDHRLIRTDQAFTDVDLAVIFQALSEDAMSIDTSPRLTLSTSPCGVLGSLSILAAQHVLVGTQLRDIARTGIDWTEVGRTVLAGGKVVPTADLGVFRDEHFIQPPLVTDSGLNKTNSWVVRGNGSGAAGDSIYGLAADVVAGGLDGVLESVAAVSTIEDNPSAQAAAQSRLALTSDIVSVQYAYLAPDAPFTLDQLVPGALCELDLADTNEPAVGQFRLQKVEVDAGSSDGIEKVGLTFQPVGTVSA